MIAQSHRTVDHIQHSVSARAEPASGERCKKESVYLVDTGTGPPLSSEVDFSPPISGRDDSLPVYRGPYSRHYDV